MWYWIDILVGLIATVYVKADGAGYIAASANVKPPITFDGANVGVNFGGYHASAGLGGLLNGDWSKGGLHAEAGTPYGQSAGAGLGGAVIGGRASGGLYAGADSGVGPAAVAGLGGTKGVSGSFGGSIAAATSGESYVSKVVETHEAPVVVEKTVEAAPAVQKTYIERTVIPNYVEKTVHVPSYVEKTIRVPTVVEQKVRVPAPPTVIEKEVDVPAEAGAIGVKENGVKTVTVVQKVRPVHVRKHWVAGYRKPGFLGGFFAAGGAGAGAGSVSGVGAGEGSSTLTVRKTANPQLINDIFNIPISTLGAVNRLVSGIVGGVSGSVEVSKKYTS